MYKGLKVCYQWLNFVFFFFAFCPHSLWELVVPIMVVHKKNKFEELHKVFNVYFNQIFITPIV
jgi:hypothetical protein